MINFLENNNILNLFPLPLAILTIFLIILPTLISISMRISLYSHLQDLQKKTRRLINQNSEGIQPKFINTLQTRFSHISKTVENVNTLALIDGIYNHETFTCFRLKIRCEEGEYITKIIPNLLLAFGLLGTFLGITTNLVSISQIINQGGGDIIDLTSQLQRPLQSMGIAFITSLIALICSSILTVINLKYNVALEKNALLNNLEDYIDNIYRLEIKNYSRLDEAVNRMVDKQTEFLTRFHENVGQVLENTFKKAADRIANDNEKSQKVIIQLYENLFDACSAISNGAIIFKNSMITLDNQVENLGKMMPKFQANIESFDRSSNKILTASDKIEKSKFSENLEQITVSLAHTQEQFTESSQLLGNNLETLIKNSYQATELATQVYQKFKVSSDSLAKSSQMFTESVSTIKESKFNDNLINATNELADTVKQFENIILNLNSIVKPLELSSYEMVNLSQDITSINNRYMEMANTSQDVLLKLGELSIYNKQSYNNFSHSINSITRDLKDKLQSLTNVEREFLTITQEIINQLKLAPINNGFGSYNNILLQQEIEEEMNNPYNQEL